jgi:hypothetical protein
MFLSFRDVETDTGKHTKIQCIRPEHWEGNYIRFTMCLYIVTLKEKDKKIKFIQGKQENEPLVISIPNI